MDKVWFRLLEVPSHVELDDLKLTEGNGCILEFTLHKITLLVCATAFTHYKKIWIQGQLNN